MVKDSYYHLFPALSVIKKLTKKDKEEQKPGIKLH